MSDTPVTYQFASDGRPEVLLSFVGPEHGDHWVLQPLRDLTPLYMLGPADREIALVLLRSAVNVLESLDG